MTQSEFVAKCNQMLMREWYKLNDIKTHPEESERDVAIRVGRKSELTRVMFLIRKHFDDETDLYISE